MTLNGKMALIVRYFT